MTEWKAGKLRKAWRADYKGTNKKARWSFLFCRYVELNTKLQASYRRYNSSIPSYLRERPHHIIKHCMDRRSLAECIPSSHVSVIDKTNGEFFVRSQSDLEEKNGYKVSFGTKQPSCECYDWERQRLPCKHFFAVFLHVPLWSFDKLPEEYKDSPFFRLDRELFSPSETKEGDSITEGNLDDLPAGMDEEVHDLKDSVQFENLPRSAPRPRTSATKCRELLGQIKNLTYIVEAWEIGETLEQVKEKLEECLDLLQKTAPKENGVILEAPLQKSNNVKTMSTGKKKKKVDFKRLPVPKKKNPFTGRVGERAYNMKRSYNVSLNDMECRPAKQPKLSDVPRKTNVDAEANKNTHDDATTNRNTHSNTNTNANHSANASTTHSANANTTHSANANTTHNTNASAVHKANGTTVNNANANTTHNTNATTVNNTNANTTHNANASTVHNANAPTVNNANANTTHNAHASTVHNANANTTSNANVTEQPDKDSGATDDVTFVRSTHSNAPKISNFQLTEQDNDIIKKGQWLTDHIISAAHSVLRKQFPHAKGLENTTLGSIFNFSIQKGEFAQILNTGSHHWVLVSNAGYSNPSDVHLYDSLFSGKITLFIQKQIASILHEEGSSFKITVPKVQRQINYDDCGVFAIAFLVSLLHGLNPSDLTFDNAAMRQHLLASLKNGIIPPLPPL